MSNVSNSFSVVYYVRRRVTKSNSGGAFSTAFSTAFDSAIGVDQIVVYGVRRTISPVKLVSIGYDVRGTVSKSVGITYGVLVPVSSTKTFTVQYNVRQRVQKSFSVVYNAGSGIRGAFSTAFSSAFDSGGSTVVSKRFVIVYQTLVTPRIDKVITMPIEKNSVPPQIITTSF